MNNSMKIEEFCGLIRQAKFCLHLHTQLYLVTWEGEIETKCKWNSTNKIHLMKFTQKLYLTFSQFFTIIKMMGIVLWTILVAFSLAILF